jgi:hypothetical protein
MPKKCRKMPKKCRKNAENAEEKNERFCVCVFFIVKKIFEK